MYEPHTSALHFNENPFRNQPPVVATTFSITPDFIFSSVGIETEADVEYLTLILRPNEGTKTGTTFPRTQLQTHHLFLVDVGPWHAFWPSDLFADLLDFGTSLQGYRQH